MLVLSRKQDQDIVIGGNIRVRILKIKGNTIRLGIDAPRDVKVVRGELEIEPNSVSSEVVKVHSDDADEVQVTLVFSNDSRRCECESDRPETSNPATVPFSASKSNGSKSNGKTEGAQTASTPPSSVRFRETRSPSLHHNRLKELVKDLTRRH